MYNNIILLDIFYSIMRYLIFTYCIIRIIQYILCDFFSSLMNHILSNNVKFVIAQNYFIGSHVACSTYLILIYFKIIFMDPNIWKKYVNTIEKSEHLNLIFIILIKEINTYYMVALDGHNWRLLAFFGLLIWTKI